MCIRDRHNPLLLSHSEPFLGSQKGRPWLKSQAKSAFGHPFLSSNMKWIFKCSLPATTRISTFRGFLLQKPLHVKWGYHERAVLTLCRNFLQWQKEREAVMEPYLLHSITVPHLIQPYGLSVTWMDRLPSFTTFPSKAEVWLCNYLDAVGMHCQHL